MEAVTDFGVLQFIHGDKGGRYPFCNSIFLPESGVVIDPSSNREYLSELSKGKVKTVWLSHWHEDHIMHLDLFRDIPIWMHEADEAPLKDINTFIDWYGLDPGVNDALIENWKAMLTGMFHYHPRSAAKYMVDGEVIDLGGLTVEVIHAPGHSPGNLSFYFRELEILFIGDNDLTSFGPWYGDRYSDIDQIIASIARLRKIPAKVWLSGHKQGVFKGSIESEWDDYLAVIDRREAMLFDLLKESKSIEEIGHQWIVYGKPVEPVGEFELMEQIQMRKHAERLMAQGLVRFENGRYVRT